MEHSIILKNWEVRAILEGRKTQLRRPIMPQPPKDTQYLGFIVESSNSRETGRWSPMKPHEKYGVNCPSTAGRLGRFIWHGQIHLKQSSKKAHQKGGKKIA